MVTVIVMRTAAKRKCPVTICGPEIGAAFMPTNTGFHFSPSRMPKVNSSVATSVPAVTSSAGATNSM